MGKVYKLPLAPQTMELNEEEIQKARDHAAWLYKNRKLNLMTEADPFILGFLWGRQFTLEQMGVFDDDDDEIMEDFEMPEIIKKELEALKKSK